MKYGPQSPPTYYVLIHALIIQTRPLTWSVFKLLVAPHANVLGPALYTLTCTHTHTHARTHACTHTHTHTHTCTHTQHTQHTHTHTLVDNTVMIHFDGWSQDYNYWCPSDSVELHPVGWCKKHGWELQPPYGQQCASIF